MLGEMLGEFWGKITVNRVLPFEGKGLAPKVETSYQFSGKLIGVEITAIETFWAIIKSGGSYGDGQGIAMTNDGEIVSWTAPGTGKFTGKGFASIWRGSVFFQTQSKKLAHLNNMAAVFEFEVDENGNTHAKLWEWK